MFVKLKLKCKKDNFDKRKDVSVVKNDEFCLPLVNAKNGGNGIMYYGRPQDWNSAEYCIDIINDGAISTGNVYPQPQKTGVLYNAYLIKGIEKAFHSELVIIYLSQVLQKSIKMLYGYDNKATWDKVKNNFISLPVYNDRIAFDYMESFIRELEQDRIRELDAYLKVSSLNDTELTDEEKECLEKFERGEITYREFKIEELFEVQKVKTKLSKLDIKENSRVPVYSSDTTNSGIYGYSDTATFHVTDKFPCYLIFGDHTRTFNIARCDFAVMDNVKVLKPVKMLSDQALLYIATIWQKQIPNYGYSRHWKYASKCMIKLPFCNNHIDFDTMETFIKALEKLCIRSVVEWKDKIIETTKRVVG